MTRDELLALSNVRIADPCPMQWKDMQGDEKKRFCGLCQLHVHKLSELMTEEVLALLKKGETERVCVQLYYRLDGTVMTKDCKSAWSVGVSEAARHVGRFMTVGSVVGGAAVLMLAFVLFVVTLFGDNIKALMGMSAGGLAGSTSVVPRRAKKAPRVHPVTSASAPAPARIARADQ